ncbi:hypothetical protein [Aurantiacibacter flavus]|uniref:DUF2059 domain-containing protein n=1 Tax=Aurantiacibacter flavus TaxID=3145232 RepID=A0ABV0CZP2_9SPHN
MMGNKFLRSTVCGLAMMGASSSLFAQNTEIYPSAMNEQPANAEKQALIRRFMAATGLQRELDSGSFLERYALNSQLDWNSGTAATTLFEAITGPIEALKAEYEHVRPTYQEEFERHINWEYTEEELRQLVAFFESAVGQHYIDGDWRMRAYSATNLEDIEGELVRKAVARYQQAHSPQP